MAYDYSEEEARLQRKLIPFNIVVCILCAVAIISLLFTTLLKFDMSKMGRELKEMFYKESSEGSEDSEEKEDNGGFSFEVIFDHLEGEFSFTTLDLAKAAFADTITLEDIIDSLLVKPGVIDDAILFLANDIALREYVDYDESIGYDLSAIQDIFESFGDVNSPDEMRSLAGEWVDAVNELFPGAINPSDKVAFEDEFVKKYEDTVAITGGPFDFEKFVCVFASDRFETEQTYTSYSAFLAKMIDKNGELSDKIEEIGELVKMLPRALFGFIMFVVAMWGILFLFSLFHMLARNKRFVTWYVKIFGFLPCLFFGVAPLVLGKVFTSIGGGFATMSALFGAMSTMTWISGGCYVLLWLVCLFWGFPIKHKIRKDRKS